MYQGNTHLYYYGINLVRSRDNESMKSTPLKDEKGWKPKNLERPLWVSYVQNLHNGKTEGGTVAKSCKAKQYSSFSIKEQV